MLEVGIVVKNSPDKLSYFVNILTINEPLHILVHPLEQLPLWRILQAQRIQRNQVMELYLRDCFHLSLLGLDYHIEYFRVNCTLWVGSYNGTHQPHYPLEVWLIIVLFIQLLQNWYYLLLSWKIGKCRDIVVYQGILQCLFIGLN